MRYESSLLLVRSGIGVQNRLAGKHGSPLAFPASISLESSLDARGKLW